MHLFQAPAFDRQIACVTDDAELAAAISSFVGEEDQYLAVLPGPRMDRPDYRSEVVRRCNAVAKVGAGVIVLAGLSESAEQEIRKVLSGRPVIRVTSSSDLKMHLAPFRRSGLEGELRCHPDDTGRGLLEAKRLRKFLVIDNSAKLLESRGATSSADHVVALDDHDGMAQVIAANYAYSLNADLVILPQRNDRLREAVYRELDERVAFRGQERGERASQSLAQLGASLDQCLQFGRRRFVTFVTRGIPYGYFYRDAPSTHLFSYPQLGELIVSGIYWVTAQPFCLAAVLVDPGDFSPSETPIVSASLMRDGVVVELVEGERATTELVQLYMQAYPYDLLFICSHCGEVPGTRLTVRVPDSEGHDRIVVIDEAVQFAGDSFGDNPGEYVEVHQLRCPVSIDGLPWHEADPDVKRHYESIWAHFRQTPRNELSVVSEEEISHVPHSTAIMVKYGGVMLSLIQVIDVSVSPVVFVNSCVSYYDAASALTFAGARAYVGTLAPVPTVEAQQLAEAIFEQPAKEQSLPFALWSAQQRIFPNPDDRTYVHVGCHFTRIVPPRREVSALVRRRIQASKARWEQPVEKGRRTPADVLRKFVRFLSALLSRR